MNKSEVLPETAEAEEKTYVVNCKTCGAALRVKDGAGAYMCPVCNKLFTLRKCEKLVKEVNEEEKQQFLKLQAMGGEAWEESETEEKLPEESNDDKVVWEVPQEEEAPVWEEEETQDDWDIEDAEATEDLPVEDTQDSQQEDWSIDDVEDEPETWSVGEEEKQEDWSIENAEEDVQEEWNVEEESETEADQGWIEVLDDAPMSKAEKKAIKAQAKAERKAAASAVKAEKKSKAAKEEKKNK